MKKGAASFYIVAFSTLILMVIATSFAMVIMSEITRSMNDDLSQSAYDSALAGVEDAKVAYSNYRRCKEARALVASTKPEGAGPITCADVLYWVEKEPDSCYTVARILGKVGKTEEKEVELGGTATSDPGGVTTTNQAYTCVKIDTEVEDYRATLGVNNKVQTIRAAVGDRDTNKVNKIKIAWYAVRNDLKERKRLTWSNFDSSKVVFGKIGQNPSGVSLPPTLEVQILQTGWPTFNLDDFDKVGDNQTNRATLYLVPTEGLVSDGDDNSNYNNRTSNNTISPPDVVKTNDRTQMNKPYTIKCPEDTTDGFYCRATIELPKPIGGGDRSNETFMISVSLPYQQPDTDFSITLYCDGDDDSCGRADGSIDAEAPGMLKNTQISIDSTGRANDLFRRVETRLETSDTTYASGYPYYALEILGGDPVKKNMTVYYEKKEGCGGPGCFYF